MKKLRLAMKVTAIVLNLAILAVLLTFIIIYTGRILDYRPLLLGILTPILSLLAIFGLGQNYKLGKVLKTIAVLLTAGCLWWLFANEPRPELTDLDELKNAPKKFFTAWIITLALVFNIIEIVLFDLASQLKALFKGKNPHIVAAYVFVTILVVLLTVFVIKL